MGGTLSPEAGVTSSVMKWLHCLSHGPGGQVSLFVFNLAEIIGWLKDSFAGRDLLNSRTNLLVSLSFSLAFLQPLLSFAGLEKHLGGTFILPALSGVISEFY